MILTFIPNWSELSLLEQAYWVIAAPATLVFIFLLIMTIFSSDVDTDLQSGIDHPIMDGDGIPFQFLSVKNIIGFFTMFGWSGLGFIGAGLHTFLVIFLSFICGLLMMLAMASLFYFMSKLAENGTLRMSNAIGRIGQVYLTIPAKRETTGKVQITVQGTLQTLDAITDEGQAIPTSSMVEVMDVIDNQLLLVRKITNE